MFQIAEFQNLEDYFIELNHRKGKIVYFYRLNSYQEEMNSFILKYYEAARLSGVVIEGKIENPDEKQLSYYEEMMGREFFLNREFIYSRLKVWLPRMKQNACEAVAESMYETLCFLKQNGKNENILKNAYIKFMCWLYYKFERMVNHLGETNLPKILYEGSVSFYELLLLSILSKAGCDILLLQYHGDLEYQKLDADSIYSHEYKISNGNQFPENFSLKQMQIKLKEKNDLERLYGVRPQISSRTNVWIEGDLFENIKKNPSIRGKQEGVFYNCFCQISGVEDKFTYANELYRLQLELKNNKRLLLILNGKIPLPSPEEIAQIQRRSCQSLEELLSNLSENIRYSKNIELERLLRQAFLNLFLEEAKKGEMKLNRLTNKAVYLLCWLRRYQESLFSNWRIPQVSCLFFFGACKNENEALFLRFLAKLPMDVVIFNPKKETGCLNDSLLYEITYEDALNIEEFPQDNAKLQISTVAYQAERELDKLLYQDSGFYRDYQYTRANAISLKTMFEEIFLLWNEELKVRPNFSIVDDCVNMPVLFAKISGVKDGQVVEYWKKIKSLLTEDTILITKIPYVTSICENSIKPYATEFFKNGRLQREKIKAHSTYPYGFLRPAVQEYLLDKLELLITQRTIVGTFENGTEYTIVSTVLNLEKRILRLIQNFDFTKKNPKLIYIITKETALSLEDSICAAYLNVIGFDILFFVPTAYQAVERYFREPILEEYLIGECVYDLNIPEFGKVSSNIKLAWHERLFKRSN